MSRQCATPNAKNNSNSIAKTTPVPAKQVPVWVSVFAPIGFLIIWSGGAIFAKVGLHYTNSWSFLFLRSLLAFSLLSMLLIFSKACLLRLGMNKVGTSSVKTSFKDLAYLLTSGLLLQVLYLTFYFSAIDTGLSLGIIILILGTQPIVTAGLSAHHISAKAYGLLLVCFVGLSLATLGYHQVDSVSIRGLLLSIMALLSMTFGTIMQANVRTAPLTALWSQTLLSLVIFTGVVCARGFSFAVTLHSVMALLWMGAVVSVGAYLLLMLMLSFSRADKVSTLFFVLPLLTMILESLVFSTVLTPLTILGVAVVCLALLFYQRLSS